MNNNGDNNTTFPGVTNTTGAVPQPQTPPVTQPFTSAAPSFQQAPEAVNIQPPVAPSSFGAPAAPVQPMAAQTPPPSPVPGSASWGTPQAQPATPAWTPPASTPPPTTPSFTPPPPSSDFKPEHEGKSKLPLLIAGILLILAIAGGYFLYMLYQAPAAPVEQATPVENTVQEETPTPTMTEEEDAQAEIDALENVSPSDDVESIQEDVNNTDFSTIDSGLTPTQ